MTPLAVTPLQLPDELLFPLTRAQVEKLVHRALLEDGAYQDITTIATVLSNRRARGTLVARQTGVVAGIPLALEAFRLVDPKVSIRIDVEDGVRVATSHPILFVTGHARAVLSAERVALNFLARLSGIATLTSRFVEAVRGTKARIVDTRKTTPGWRRLEKYAVRAGGGLNHRLDLATGILIKDNHLAAVDGDIGIAVRRAREKAPAGMRIEVECDRPEQVEAAMAAGADIVMLDNMHITTLRECVQIVNGRAIVEASGGVTLETVRAIAMAGVDWISVGALTHSAPAMDVALDFDPA
ncbi:MAG: carboxylating nicotinate-nucleotide diphosphorylase [Gemmatimonadota bacterium]|nr:carboxylating nicotinate-nucleotide diphosphorylase [Gemmatimonadota bacterium]